MAALCYNLKKYLKFCRKLPQIMAKRIAIPQGMLFAIKNDILRPIFSRNTPSNFLDFFSLTTKIRSLKTIVMKSNFFFIAFLRELCNSYR